MAIVLTGQVGQAIVPPSATSRVAWVSVAGALRGKVTCAGKSWSDVMADDDAATVEQLQAENRRLQARLAAVHAENSELRDQQDATADILRIIATSPTDALPVLEAILRSASRLVASGLGLVHIFDGECLRTAASDRSQVKVGEVLRLDERRIPVRAFLERRTIHIDDRSDPVVLSEYPDTRHFSKTATLSVPLLREKDVIGVLEVGRDAAQPYSEREIALIETFAHQAAIAVENSRLFEELEQRNRDLSESLEQQTATAEVLRVIASAPTDVQLVLETVARSALRLCTANQVLVYRLDGDLMKRAALGRPLPADDRSGSWSPQPEVPLSRDFVAGRAAVERRTIHVHDLLNDPDFPVGQQMAAGAGHRTTLGIPLLLEGTAIGALSATNREVQPFTDQQIALLETFADQAVIAIENAGCSRSWSERNRAHERRPRRWSSRPRPPRCCA